MQTTYCLNTGCSTDFLNVLTQHLIISIYVPDDPKFIANFVLEHLTGYLLLSCFHMTICQLVKPL